ncbi:hypothetical protein BDZ94DRAFT_762226 [Collybia nuda]|uniref:Uncharacterized protein n=1 Tax=Collybia nuda TaxID=64659 RepID=A0A9P6CH92_9AGAR|nr:hypothetical protein BDZ94DRAFT_762226 [Collybia nuda]
MCATFYLGLHDCLLWDGSLNLWLISHVSPPTAGLMASLAASVMYGMLNIVAFFTCLYVLFQRRTGGNGVPWFILWAAIIQFLISTIHIATCWRQMLEAFIWTRYIPGATLMYFIADPAKPTEVISKSFLTDSILTWRLYMVWGKNILVCIVPLVTMIAYMITSSIGVVKLCQLPATNENFFVISQWFVASLGLTLTTHVLVTSMILGKIWRQVQTNVIYAGKKRHMAVVWIILESGTIYSIIVLFLVVFIKLKTQLGGIISNIFVQLCELIPTLIIVRVGLGLTSDLTTRNLDTTLTAVQFHCPMELGVHEMVELEEGQEHTTQKVGQGIKWKDNQTCP